MTDGLKNRIMRTFTEIVRLTDYEYSGVLIQDWVIFWKAEYDGNVLTASKPWIIERKLNELMGI